MARVTSKATELIRLISDDSDYIPIPSEYISDDFVEHQKQWNTFLAKLKTTCASLAIDLHSPDQVSALTTTLESYLAQTNKRLHDTIAKSGGVATMQTSFYGRGVNVMTATLEGLPEITSGIPAPTLDKVEADAGTRYSFRGR
jgi:hypothetical protein